MSLIIRNLQRAIPIRRVPLRKNIEQLRCILGVQHFDLGVICNLKAGELPQHFAPDEYNLGDIFLGVEYIFQQCEEYSEDYYNILTVTVAHGMCHLLGYKHSTKADWEEMYKKETQILQELSRLSGTNFQPLTKNHF